MLVNQLAPEQIIRGMVVQHPDRGLGRVEHIDYHDGRYAWILWDGETKSVGGFYNTTSTLEVVSGYGPHTLEQASSAGVLLFNEVDDTILAVSRRNNSNDLGLPFGKIEPGETALQAAVRETLEETGAKLDPRRLEPIWVRNGRYKPAACFLGMLRKSTPLLHSTEEGVVVWANPSALTDYVSFAEYNAALLELVDRPRIWEFGFWLGPDEA